MADYGITNFVDDNEFYIRQSCCAATVRFRKERDYCPHCGRSDTRWVVEIINDTTQKSGGEVFTFSNEEDTEKAACALANFIDDYGGHYLKEAVK